MISIRKPLYFSEIGRKDNQEDYLFPSSASVNERVFILCDGMGGHDNGEVASRVAANTLGDFLLSYKNVDTTLFQEGLTAAYDALDVIDTNSERKPGTTMTCLCLNEENYLVAHIGDSRIYHIRPSLFNPKTGRGGIIYQSEDHSLVNDLLKASELTEDEALNFPHKNVITRAMQPHLAKRYKADIAVFNDIQAGDYFFLCCDGVLEQLSNEMLCSILADGSLNDEEKLEKIKAVCGGKTRDNYSCWLIPIKSVSLTSQNDNSDIIIAEAENGDESSKDFPSFDNSQIVPTIKKTHSRNRVLLRLFTFIFVVLAVMWCGYFAYTYVKSSSEHATATLPIKEKTKKKKVRTTQKGNSTKNPADYLKKPVFIPYSHTSNKDEDNQSEKTQNQSQTSTGD
ncbi:MAG: protein phosphatase 2C domain-containing protein [Muribaculaceae bacterium]|nr:protein phosphatase 2C domain-containing protein [Muribaculaceae bacterium]